jgi:phage anti-repressor protein
MTSSSLAFTVEMAQQLLSVEDQFPVDFDNAWVWAGFSSKQKAENAMETYELNGSEQVINLGLKTSTVKGGRPSKHIRMTVDTFKEFCMVANTAKGKQIRRYFLECEKAVKSGDTQQTQNLRPDWSMGDLHSQIRQAQLESVRHLRKCLAGGASHEELSAIAGNLDALRKSAQETMPVELPRGTKPEPTEQEKEDILLCRIEARLRDIKTEDGIRPRDAKRKTRLILSSGHALAIFMKLVEQGKGAYDTKTKRFKFH